MVGGDIMKKYKKITVKVDSELMDDFLNNPYFHEDDKDKEVLQYLPLINKEDSKVQDGRIVYGNGPLMIDPQGYKIQEKQILKSGNVEFNLDKGIVKKDGKILKIASAQLRLLEIFMRNPGRVMGRSQLLLALESTSKVQITDNALNVSVYRLREKLGKSFIETHSKQGYSWHPEVE